ncbi:LETM1-like protein [Striga asiatica]|uniref:LETM1-like protein n=1 Tax=Striga asiatica TaxID=4170 RepID=A0A5A7P887_STRAF|nr:LETM1-like protein [Striga asiatica]
MRFSETSDTCSILELSVNSSSPWVPIKPIRVNLVVGPDRLVFNHSCTWTRGPRVSHVKFSFRCKLSDLGKQSSSFHKLRRIDRLLPLASADDGVTVNSKPQARTGDEIGGKRYKLDESLKDEDYSTGMVQLLHDAARVFELAIKEQSSASKTSWFSTAWLGVDRNAWAKALSYQAQNLNFKNSFSCAILLSRFLKYSLLQQRWIKTAAVYSLLQAASEISSRGDGRDRDINVFVQRRNITLLFHYCSISRQSSPLESVINDKLLDKQPEAYDWFWSEQIPAVVTSFVNYFDKEKRFAPANAVYRKGLSAVSGNSSDISLLLLALSCIAAIMKLGPTKVSCAQFFSIVPDITGRLMDMLVEFVPVGQAYNSIKEIGMRREFLTHFGPRAAACRVKNELDAEEIVFWVSLVQKQLRRAIDRERIWSRLTTSESIEVLERDLAIFGFFIALGRSTQSYLFANGYETLDEPIEGFIRYLIGGTVLYYPQLSAISSYQLYVEVVCEELDWVPFYPGSSSNSKRTIAHKRNEAPPNTEAIALVLDVCSHWIESFIKYSKWLENPSNVKAARFLSKGHNKLKACMEELGIQKNRSSGDKEAQLFDKALENVEEALLRLEELLQELHVSSSSSRKEHLKAACSDLERIRRLKKETEFLEASFRAKAASLQQGAVSGLRPPVGEQQLYSREKGSKGADAETDGSRSFRGLWGFFIRRPNKFSGPSSLTANDSQNDGIVEQENTNNGITESESDEIQRFELLRSELMELEKRVQRSADQCGHDEVHCVSFVVEYYQEEVLVKYDTSTHNGDAKGSVLVAVQKKDSIIGRSLDKLKETSTDVLQGTQLLAIDTAAALGLLRRVLTGDELTEKEKQALRRTLTDLASVLPIGFLMLLPVTAVGHAAMLAAIQRYMPALIPSTYGQERLDLLRQLEKVKEMEDEVAVNEHSDDE